MWLLRMPGQGLQFLGREEGLETGVVLVVRLLKGGMAVFPGHVFGTWEEFFEELVLAGERYV